MLGCLGSACESLAMPLSVFVSPVGHPELSLALHLVTVLDTVFVFACVFAVVSFCAQPDVESRKALGLGDSGAHCVAAAGPEGVSVRNAAQ